MNYADSSFLVSFYGTEAHSGSARSMMGKGRSGLWFTQLHRVECENALAQSELRKVLNETEAAAVAAAIDADLRAGVLIPVQVPEMAWGRCANLAREHGRQIFIRTLDTLHVACALELDAEEF